MWAENGFVEIRDADEDAEDANPDAHEPPGMDAGQHVVAVGVGVGFGGGGEAEPE